jgi:membrane-associated phospholipid phosphatase
MTGQIRDEQRSSNSASDRGAHRPEFRRLHKTLRDEVRRHRALVIAGLGMLAVVGTMAYFTSRREMLPLDLRATVRLQSVRFSPFADLMYAVSIPGYYPWNALIVTAGSLVIARWLNWRDGAYVAGLTIAQGLMNHTIKTTVGRPRPTDSVVEVIFPNTGLSFPSGHVMFYTAFFGFAFFLALTRLRRSPGRKLVLATSGALIVLVGPSRIYLGAHWLSDVVAGHMLSLVILLLGVEVYVRYVQERQSLDSSDRHNAPPSGKIRMADRQLSLSDATHTE